MLESSGGIRFVILVEDSDTGAPSLITVRMEYLLYNSEVVNLVCESNEGEAGTIIVNVGCWWTGSAWNL